MTKCACSYSLYLTDGVNRHMGYKQMYTRLPSHGFWEGRFTRIQKHKNNY